MNKSRTTKDSGCEIVSGPNIGVKAREDLYGCLVP